MSQHALALSAGISARHLSFIETGRSHPGRGVIAALARALELPHRETNALLRAHGERPLYPESGLENEDARPLRLALERMLEAHMPWPAVVMDHAWHPVQANPAFEALTVELSRYADSPPGGRGMMEWLFARDGLQPLVVNWAEVAPFLLRRVRHEAVLYPDLDPLVERLETETGASAFEEPVTEPRGVVLALHLALGERSLGLFSLLAGFGSALDAGLDELRMEYFCPVDHASDEWLAALSGSAGREGPGQRSADG